MAERACGHATIEGFAGAGERIIVAASVPFGTPGGANNLRIATVGRRGALCPSGEVPEFERLV